MAGYIGSKSSVTQVDGYTEAEADATFLTPTGDGSGLTGLPSGTPSIVDNGNATAITITSDENVGIGTSSGANLLNIHQSDASSNSYLHITHADSGSSASNGLSLGLEGDGVNAVIRNRENGYLRMYTNNTERMRITGSGNLLFSQTAGDVGGGHLTSGIKLDSSGYVDTAKASGFVIRANRQTTEGDIIAINYNGSPIGALGSVDTYNFAVESKFADKNIEFKVNKGGSTATVAQFYGNTGAKSFGSFESFSGGYNIVAGAGSAASYAVRMDAVGTGSAGVLQVVNGYGQVGSISVNGASTSFNTSSDYRLKTDVQPMTGASARVQALNPVNFEWIADGTRVDGFLAHEAQEVVPEAIIGTKDAMKDEPYEVTPAVEATYDEEGNELTASVEAVMGTHSVPDHQSIDQSKLVPLLTAALQEALTEIASLKTRVEALEA